MGRSWILLGTLFGATGVMLGAFGAHGLREIAPPERLETFRTGAHYQLTHALALVGLGLWADARLRNPKLVGSLLVLGILFFSGSLYALVLTGQRWFGAVAPVGGVCLIAAWLTWGIAEFRAPERAGGA